MLVGMSIALLAASLAFGAQQLIKFPVHARVLFQGDSITDMNRGRSNDPNHILGHSYAFLIASRMGASFPERNVEFINRGISGNKLDDLLSRWQMDTLDLKPTIVSILIGINDVEATTPLASFEGELDRLVTLTASSLPGVKIVMCEPFGLCTGWRKSKWAELEPRLRIVQATTARIAKNHGAIFVPLQAAFDSALKRANADFWIWDGIHPTYAGQQIIADEWCNSVARRLR